MEKNMKKTEKPLFVYYKIVFLHRDKINVFH